MKNWPLERVFDPKNSILKIQLRQYVIASLNAENGLKNGL